MLFLPKIFSDVCKTRMEQKVGDDPVSGKTKSLKKKIPAKNDIWIRLDCKEGVFISFCVK